MSCVRSASAPFDFMGVFLQSSLCLADLYSLPVGHDLFISLHFRAVQRLACLHTHHCRCSVWLDSAFADDFEWLQVLLPRHGAKAPLSWRMIAKRSHRNTLLMSTYDKHTLSAQTPLQLTALQLYANRYILPSWTQLIHVEDSLWKYVPKNKKAKTLITCEHASNR